MRKSLAMLLCWALFPLTAWSALGIGDFTLGMSRQQVLDTLKPYFAQVNREYNLSYSVPMPYYRALEPNHPYSLGDVPIYVVGAYFDDADRLKQLSISFNTTDVERVKRQVPLMQKAQLVPDTDGRHEVFLTDGELIYRVSNVFDWTTVEIADKATSALNIETRAHYDKIDRARRAKSK
ncbi:MULTISPECIES: hypothetical protein [Pseudomonas]|uniref:Uncharacterized protein n=1 Tax=Pseudomonas tritici TaxID=2745518 RepID=A0A8H9YZH9_9PSED|nr:MULTISPECIES: hypothetical protein [Pseudomonas]MBP2869854.1 hypothetical protein [Pseudomonas sp. SWRI144]MBW8126608.1 hypothetical protein [Pseudomonas sp. LAP_36]MBW8135371.1 hypothetical protein [Pseudomonas sp. PAMC 26818]QXH81188.1 hypothetical protein HU722_0014110 [Pseudomonas tritici]CRM09978.1 hypothetical protein [Pseudomonas sp. 58 R 12]